MKNILFTLILFVSFSSFGQIEENKEFEYMNFEGKEILIVKGSLVIKKNNKRKLKFHYVDSSGNKFWKVLVGRTVNCKTKIMVDDFGKFCLKEIFID